MSVALSRVRRVPARVRRAEPHGGAWPPALRRFGPDSRCFPGRRGRCRGADPGGPAGLRRRAPRHGRSAGGHRARHRGTAAPADERRGSRRRRDRRRYARPKPRHRPARPATAARRGGDPRPLGVIDRPGRRAPLARNRARARDRRQRQARHDLRRLRPLRTDRRLAVVLVGRRAGAAPGRALRAARPVRPAASPPSSTAASSSTTKRPRSPAGRARSSVASTTSSTPRSSSSSSG